MEQKIELRSINGSNVKQCIALRVSDEQRQYIASNGKSLRQAAEIPAVARPFAIYAGQEMVGFAMFAFDEACEDPSDRYWLWRFMIDRNLQGQGYGSAALEEIIRYFREHGANPIRLSTKESNTGALALYHKFGFRETGEMNGEEIVLQLEL